MANLAAKRPDYTGPDRATRFTTERPGLGKPATKWLRAKVEEIDPATGKAKRELIADRLIEMALDSGRDGVEAAKLLFTYIYGKAPVGDEEMRLALAGHFRQVAKDAAEIVLASLGSRKETMDPAQVAQFIAAVSVNTRAYLDAADEDMARRGHGPAQLSATPPAAPTTAQPQTVNEASQPEAGTNLSETEGGE